MARKKEEKSIGKDIFLIVSILAAILIFISLIGMGGFVGNLVSGFMFGIFGIVAYIFPFYFIFACIFYLIINKNKSMLDLAVLIVLFLCLLFTAELITLMGKDYVFNPIEAYQRGRTTQMGGGFFGACLSFVLSTAFGKAGALAIDIFAILLSLLLITRVSIIEYLVSKRDKSRVKKNSERKPKGNLRSSKYNDRDYEEDVQEFDEEIPFDEDIADTAEDVQNTDKISAISRVREAFARKSNPKKSQRLNSSLRGIDFNSIETNSTENVNIVPMPMESAEPTEAVSNIDHFSLSPKSIQEDSNSNYGGENINPIQDTADTISFDNIKETENSSFEAESLELESILSPGLSEISMENSVTENIYGVNDPIPEDTYRISPADGTASISEPEVISEIEPIAEYDEISEINPMRIEDFSDTAIPAGVSENSSVSATPINRETEPIPQNNTEPVENVVHLSASNSDIQDTKPKYVFPPIDLLIPGKRYEAFDNESLNETADKLVTTLSNFGVEVTISDISHGPSVTRFELIPSQGVKVSKIMNLSDDIKLNLAAADIRIEAPIPGKSAVGIEVPNKSVETVQFRDLIEDHNFTANKSRICFGAGKDLSGNIVISDIAKMPHVLIAGATGSGKSVCINTIIMSILYHASPDEVKFIMIDPKVVELSIYNGIPHLLTPVVSDPKKAAGVLNWAVNEMNNRYKKFADLSVRDMAGYNKKISSPDFADEHGIHNILPQIVVIVDELADLMMVSSSEVEESICRLAQLARAAGIHLVIATQRPSVNVITGLIKANMPSRIAFAVTSGIDSRTILDMNGAEKLLGKGDMLYFPQGYSKPIRVQGAFVSDDEVSAVTDFIKANNMPGNDNSKEDEIQKHLSDTQSKEQNEVSASFNESRDEYFENAGRLIIEKEKGSIGMLQRNFKIGFNRAARIMDQLTEAGVVGAEEGTKPRKVLISMEEFESLLMEDIN